MLDTRPPEEARHTWPSACVSREPDWRRTVTRGLAQRVLDQLASSATYPPGVDLRGYSPRNVSKIDQLDTAIAAHYGPAFCGKLRADARNKSVMVHYVMASVAREITDGGTSWTEPGLQLLTLYTLISRRAPSFGRLLASRVYVGRHALERLIRRLSLPALHTRGADYLVTSVAGLFRDTALVSEALATIARQHPGDVIAPVTGGALLGVTQGEDVLLRTVVSEGQLFPAQLEAVTAMRQAAAALAGHTGPGFSGAFTAAMQRCVAATMAYRAAVGERRQYHRADAADRRDAYHKCAEGPSLKAGDE